MKTGEPVQKNANIEKEVESENELTEIIFGAEIGLFATMNTWRAKMIHFLKFPRLAKRLSSDTCIRKIEKLDRTI